MRGFWWAYLAALGLFVLALAAVWAWDRWKRARWTRELREDLDRRDGHR